MFLMETISWKMADYYIGRKNVQIIDLRSEQRYQESHIKGAVNYPYEKMKWKQPGSKEKLQILYCERGGASLAAARELAARGYRTRSLVGGFASYRGRNLVFSDIS